VKKEEPAAAVKEDLPKMEDLEIKDEEEEDSDKEEVVVAAAAAPSSNGAGETKKDEEKEAVSSFFSVLLVVRTNDASFFSFLWTRVTDSSLFASLHPTKNS